MPMVFGEEEPEGLAKSSFHYRVDEQADLMARKCFSYFGPNNQPRLEIGFRNEVLVDSAGRVVLATLEQYKTTVGERTWNAVLKYTGSLKGKKIAFFNSTPQGGGVALMRHALVRFLRLLEVDVSWYTRVNVCTE